MSKFNNEVEVSEFYISHIKKELGCLFKAKFNTDGLFYIKEKNLLMLTEFKHGFKPLTDSVSLLLKCVAQILGYIIIMEDRSSEIPDLIFIGTEHSFTIFKSSILLNSIKYTPKNIAPSNMFLYPPEELIEIIKQDIKNINIFNISELHMLKNIISDAGDKKESLKIRITQNNSIFIFQKFIDSNILQNINKINDNEMVAIFLNLIFGKGCDIERVPGKIVIENISQKQIIDIDRFNYSKFISSIHLVNDEIIQEHIVQKSDIFIKEITRRKNGEFYTPGNVVEFSDSCIEKYIDEKWNKKYIVWDVCSGQNQLTQNKDFNELYCSTLHQTDIDLANSIFANPEATKFQYDFLNDDVYADGLHGLHGCNGKLLNCAPSLVDALKNNKNIIIDSNFPFAGARGGDLYGGAVVKTSDNRIKDIMQRQKIGKASEQSYMQFLFRILMITDQYRLKNINICCYTLPGLWTKASYEKFRNIFFKKYRFVYGYLCDIKVFSGTTKGNPFIFSIWNRGEEKRNVFEFDVVKEINGVLKIDGKCFLETALENNLAKNWGKPIKQSINIDINTDNKKIRPIITSGLNIKYNDKNEMEFKEFDSSFLGWIEVARKVIEKRHVTILTSAYSSPAGYIINSENFYRVVANFAVQRAIKETLENKHDEYLKPNTNHQDYNRWNFDALVYSLFNSGSYQSSMKFGEKILIDNEFFWASNKIIQTIAKEYDFKALLHDASKYSNEKYVFLELQKNMGVMSQEALNTLNKANELLYKTIKDRKIYFDNNHLLAFHLYRWDTGWCQIRDILSKNDREEFNKIYHVLETKITEGIYKFGFLK